MHYCNTILKKAFKTTHILQNIATEKYFSCKQFEKSWREWDFAPMSRTAPDWQSRCWPSDPAWPCWAKLQANVFILNLMLNLFGHRVLMVEAQHIASSDDSARGHRPRCCCCCSRARPTMPWLGGKPIHISSAQKHYRLLRCKANRHSVPPFQIAKCWFI